MKNAVRSISFLLIAAALCIGFVTRIATLARYITFGNDQANAGILRAGMLQGSWPTLGLIVSNGWFHVPPMNLYFAFPFMAAFGYEPLLQAAPNAVFSFLTIPLVMIATYRLLDGAPTDRRFLLSSVSGLWWSLLFVDIVIGSKEWSPSPIPFFSLLFLLIAADLIKNPSCDRRAFLLWTAQGALAAVLASLHGTTMYETPAFFALLSIVFVMKTKNRARSLLLVIYAAFIAVLVSMPYWLGEIARGWANSKEIIASLHRSLHSGSPVFNVLKSYTSLADQVYFLGDDAFLRDAGTLFLFMILFVALIVFRGDVVLFSTFLCSWTFFLLTTARYPATFVHYKLLIIAAPIFLSAVSLGFLDYEKIRYRAVGALLLAGMLTSAALNASADVRRMDRIFGATPLVGVPDVEEAFRSMPGGATFCHPPESFKSDYYIDRYVTHRDLQFSKICPPSSYEIIPAFNGAADVDYQHSHGFFSFVKNDGVVPAPLVADDMKVVMQDRSFKLVFLKNSLHPRPYPRR